MKLFIDFWYCFIEALTDLKKIIYRNSYQKRFGSGWEKPFLDFLMQEANNKFFLFSMAFWYIITTDLLIMTTTFADAYLFHHDLGKSFGVGLLVSIIIVLPYYLWRKKTLKA